MKEQKGPAQTVNQLLKRVRKLHNFHSTNMIFNTEKKILQLFYPEKTQATNFGLQQDSNLEKLK